MPKPLLFDSALNSHNLRLPYSFWSESWTRSSELSTTCIGCLWEEDSQTGSQPLLQKNHAMKYKHLTEEQTQRNMQKHVLYNRYKNVMKNVEAGSATICQSWKNFDDFVADIKKSIGLPRDSRDHLKRKDRTKEYNKSNVYWFEHRTHSVTEKE